VQDKKWLCLFNGKYFNNDNSGEFGHCNNKNLAVKKGESVGGRGGLGIVILWNIDA